MTRISDGNSKLVGIPNISLVPCKNCAPDAPCKKSCYAMKFFRMYPSVKKAWTENSKQLEKDRTKYFDDIRKFLAKKMPRFFRWHVAGDIPDMPYLAEMIKIAYEFRGTKFLCFTKRHDLVAEYYGDDAPLNMEIVLSMWPKWGSAKFGKGLKNSQAKSFRRAWMQDGTETRVPADAVECPGACHNCGACWNLKNLKRDVVFHKH